MGDRRHEPDWAAVERRADPVAANSERRPPHIESRVPPDLSEDAEGEHCYDCGKAVGLIWTAPDSMWAEVTGRPDGGGLLCIKCFDERAEAMGLLLRWVPQPAAQPAPPERSDPLDVDALAWAARANRAWAERVAKDYAARLAESAATTKD